MCCAVGVSDADMELGQMRVSQFHSGPAGTASGEGRDQEHELVTVGRARNE